MKKMMMFGLLVAAAGAAFGQDKDVLYVPSKVAYAPGIDVPNKVRLECNLDVRVVEDIAHNAYSVYANVVREKPKKGKYHVLELEINEVFGVGGGSWSGPKKLGIRGKLLDQNGNVLGTFTARRHSMGGVMAGLKGTCKILHRCSKALGEDLRAFLASPVSGVHLGD